MGFQNIAIYCIGAILKTQITFYMWFLTHATLHVCRYFFCVLCDHAILKTQITKCILCSVLVGHPKTHNTNCAVLFRFRHKTIKCKFWPCCLVTLLSCSSYIGMSRSWIDVEMLSWSILGIGRRSSTQLKGSESGGRYDMRVDDVCQKRSCLLCSHP